MRGPRRQTDAGTPPAASNVYGCPWAADGLANIEIGKAQGREVSYRFRVRKTGTFTQARFFFIFRAVGYYQGNGGQIKIELKADDGSAQHLPGGAALSSVLITDPMAETFRMVTFSSAVTLQGGKLYHFVFTNPASDPVNNWTSIDDLYHTSGTPDMQPTVSDTDLAVVWKYGSSYSWEVAYQHTPIFEVYFQDGHIEGQGYIDTRVGDPLSIGGSNKVRATFTVSGANATVSEANVRLRRLGSSGALTMALTRNGTVIDQVTVNASEVGTSYGWVQGQFPSSHVLTAGMTYSLELSSASGSYATYVLQQGTNYGFETPSMFLDGHAEYSSGGSWSDFQGRTDFDYQLYLR